MRCFNDQGGPWRSSPGPSSWASQGLPTSWDTPYSASHPLGSCRAFPHPPGPCRPFYSPTKCPQALGLILTPPGLIPSFSFTFWRSPGLRMGKRAAWLPSGRGHHFQYTFSLHNSLWCSCHVAQGQTAPFCCLNSVCTVQTVLQQSGVVFSWAVCGSLMEVTDILVYPQGIVGALKIPLFREVAMWRRAVWPDLLPQHEV